MAARRSQRAILQGVGRQLVDRQGQREGLPGFDNKWGARNRKPVFARSIWDQGGADHILERRCSPVCGGKQVVRPSERSQSSLILFEVGFARLAAKCLGGHRAKYGKRVLDAMLQLLIDKVQRFPGHVLGGDISADDKHAAHSAVDIDWTEAIGPPDILATTVTRDRYQLVLMPGRPVARHDVLDLGADDVPYLIPTLAASSSQGAWMPFGPHRLTVCIVIELDEFRSPPDEHRVTRRENEPHRNAKALRPCFRRAERSF